MVEFFRELPLYWYALLGVLVVLVVVLIVVKNKQSD